MPDDKPSPELLSEINERLKYLESVVRDQIARLYAIEQKLGIAYRPQSPTAVEPQPLPPRPVPQAGSESSQPPPPLAEPKGDIPPDQRPAEPSMPSPPLQASGVPPSKTPEIAVPSAPPKEPPKEPRPSVPAGRTIPSQVEGSRPAAPQYRSVMNVNAPQTAGRSAAPAKKRGDLESRIGGKLFNWIGVIAICVGVGFFLKLAFDRAWIGPWGRVLIGAAIGLAFLVGGERLRKRYASYAYGLSGGGILLLYLTFFAGFNRYQLFTQTTAFVLMALVTATASLLSARYNALPIAILGLIGGFMTPILVSTGVDNEWGLFGYITLLDLGVLSLAYSKHWRVLNYLSFSATVLMVIGYLLRFPWSDEKLWPTLFFLTVFFVIFALLAVLYNVVNRQPTRWLDLALVFINALLYFGASYELLEDDYQKYLGLFAVLVSSFYLLLGYFTYRRDRQDRLLIFTFLGLAFLFLVLAVPIQLDQHWVTMAWAIEGAIMTWIGLKVNDRTSRYAALVVFIIAVSHWAIVDVHDFAYQTNDVFTPVLNRRGVSCLVLAFSLAAAAWFYKRYTAEIKDEERSMFRALYLLGANALAVVLLSIDANDFFEQAKALASDRSWQELARLNNDRHVTLSVLWSIYGGTALIVGIVRGLKPLRYAALLLLALATCKVLAIDLPYYNASWHHWTFLNQTFAAFAVLIGALATSAWFYARSREVDADERSVFLPLLVATANLLAVIALSAEAIGHFERAKTGVGEQATSLESLENAKQLALSAVWIVYAATTLIIGILRRKKAMRIGALILLGLATAKVLTVDLSYFRVAWHTTLLNQSFAAFALLILALATCAWFYRRLGEDGERERAFVVPLLVGVANVLGVISLSAEAIGHFERAKTEEGSNANLEGTKQLVLTALWTAHATGALIFGIRRGWRTLRWGALALLALASLKLLFVDLMMSAEREHTLIFNQSFGALVLVVSAFAAGAWFYWRAEGMEEQTERNAGIMILATAANVLAVLGLSSEALGYFERAKAIVVERKGSADEIARLENSTQFWLSALWTIYGGSALVVGIKRRVKTLRFGALMLLTLAIIKLVLVDLRYYDADFHSLVFNQTFGAFALMIGALACGVWFYARSDEESVEERGMVIHATMAVANILAIIGLSAEASGYFKSQMKTGGLLSDAFRDLRLAWQLSLSVIWTIYGGVMLSVGILRRNRMLRMMALLLLSVTIVKVFLFDLSSLDKVYRITSFIVLGAILLAVSFLYQRFRQRWIDVVEAPAPDSSTGGQ